MIFPGIITDRFASLRLSPRRLAGLIGALFALMGLASMGDGIAIKGKAVIAQHLLEHAWARTISTDAEFKPWPWADIFPVAKITAPRFDQTAIVLSGASGEAMAFGPGLVDGTAQPGAPGLAVIAAHRDTHFRFLKNVVAGDEIMVARADGSMMTFEITETHIVRADNSGLYPEDFEMAGHAALALVTCYPFDATTRGDLRFVALVHAVSE